MLASPCNSRWHSSLNEDLVEVHIFKKILPNITVAIKFMEGKYVPRDITINAIEIKFSR